MVTLFMLEITFFIIVPITAIIIRLIYIWHGCNNAIKVYKRTGSISEALEKNEGYKFLIWNMLLRYIPVISICGLILSNMNLTGSLILPAGAFLSILCNCVYSPLVSVPDSLIRYRVDKIIKKTELSMIMSIRKTFLKEIFELRWSILVIVIVMSAYVVLFMPFECLFGFEGIDSFTVLGFRIIIFLLALTFAEHLIIYYIIPYFDKLHLHPKPIENEEVLTLVSKLTFNHNIKNVKILEFQAPVRGEGHAFLIKGLTNKIFISNHILSNFNRNELEAILMHEIGHIKLHHIFKQKTVDFLLYLFSISIFAILFVVVGVVKNIFNWGEHEFIISVALVLFVYLAGVIIKGYSFNYDGMFTFFNCIRKHEKEADEFVIKNGVEPQVLVSALQKLHTLFVSPVLDTTPISFKKIAKKLSTHPSLENRIKYINEFAESMGK